MNDVTIARALHVVFVVLWIGGVAFVTSVLLPAVRRLKAPHERMELFDQIERRFAGQARISTIVVGLTGFYMAYRFELWDHFRHAAYWWMHAMVIVWLIFSLMLFVAEPLFLHRWLVARARVKPEMTFRLVEWLHWVLLVISFVTLLGAVTGITACCFSNINAPGSVDRSFRLGRDDRGPSLRRVRLRCPSFSLVSNCALLAGRH
jgi:uncharacterized membrane protein